LCGRDDAGEFGRPVGRDATRRVVIVFPPQHGRRIARCGRSDSCEPGSPRHSGLKDEHSPASPVLRRHHPAGSGGTACVQPPGVPASTDERPPQTPRISCARGRVSPFFPVPGVLDNWLMPSCRSKMEKNGRARRTCE
jgi:hypothetical protein